MKGFQLLEFLLSHSLTRGSAWTPLGAQTKFPRIPAIPPNLRCLDKSLNVETSLTSNQTRARVVRTSVTDMYRTGK